MGCPSSPASLDRVGLSRAKVDGYWLGSYSQQVLNHSQWNIVSTQTAWINNYRRNKFRIFKYLERELEKKQKGRGVLYSCLFHLSFVGGAAHLWVILIISLVGATMEKQQKDSTIEKGSMRVIHLKHSFVL